jgi:FKBP-type peptidyl-prolyl cis-trans isomerase
MKKLYRISGVILLLLAICLVHSCKKEAVPTLTTSAITNITATSAVTGGDITSEGSGTIITRGVCWSANIDPTITDNKTLDGTGGGSYISNITGLILGTTYHIRAYATNSTGTGYGLDLIFSTLDQAGVEKAIIQKYIIDNQNLFFQLKSSGLYYLDIKIGTGPSPVTHDTASIFYTLKLLDGTIIDSNLGTSNPYVFIVGENMVIEGIDEGVTYMKEGGEALFLTPSVLAWGAYEIPGLIAGYTPVLFDVNLVSVKR